MMVKEKKSEFDQQMAFTEYLASFWNPEAVKKIREARAQSNQHAFKDDKEFEESIINESYKNNPLVKALKNFREQQEKTGVSENVKTKKPTDLSELSRLIKNI